MSWSKEPPKEPGWYFVRRAILGGHVVKHEVVHLDGYNRIRTTGVKMSLEGAKIRGWLWWSEQIKEPFNAVE